MQITKQIEKMDTLSIKSKSKGKWFDIVLANVIGLTIVMLGFFIPVLSFALALIIYSYMQTGIYGFALQTYQGQNTDYENLFLPFNLILKILCLKIIVMAGIVLWGLLLIVPGIIYGLNYSFSAFILFENPNLKIREILKTSKTLTNGKKMQIFLLSLASIAIVCLGASIGVGLYYLFGLFMVVPTYLTVILITLPTILMLLIVALPFFEIYLAGIYESVKIKNIEKNAKQNKPAKKVSKS